MACPTIRASYRYGCPNRQHGNSRDDLRQLRARRGAKTLRHAGRNQSDGRPPGRQRHGTVRCGEGDARSAGRRRPPTWVRSGGMSAAPSERADLPVSGMTCAACARSIEGALAGTPGVERARVNLATNTATVEYDPAQAGLTDFVAAIEGLGYGVPKADSPPQEESPDRRLLVAAILAVPVLVLGMSHGAFVVPYSTWTPVALRLPLMFSSGAPIYAAAWTALRHRSANMNSLIALACRAEV